MAIESLSTGYVLSPEGCQVLLDLPSAPISQPGFISKRLPIDAGYQRLMDRVTK